MSISVCPKCHAPRQNGNECPACGVIYAKAEQADRERQALAAAAAEKAARQQAAEEADRAKVVARQLAKLNACKTCGAAIAKTASACTHCGAKQTQRIGKTGLALIGFFTVAMIVGVSNSTDSFRDAEADAARVAREHPEIAFKTDAHNTCLQRLKSALRDPDSLSIDDTIQGYVAATAQSPGIVYTTFDIRARNGFGGMNRESHMCEAFIVDGRAIVNQFIKIK